MKTCLPDVNIWIALSFESHEHHHVAKSWFVATPTQRIGFCRTTQQGFLRIATNPRAFGNDALSMPEAWGAFDAIMADSRSDWFEEPVGLESYWKSFTRDPNDSPKIWTDAYLAAFARAGDLEMVTLDRGFQRYKDLELTCLLP